MGNLLIRPGGQLERRLTPSIKLASGVWNSIERRVSMTIVYSAGNARATVQRSGSDRFTRKRSSPDPFGLLIKPAEWFTDGLLWLLEKLAIFVMRQVYHLAVALFYAGPATGLWLVRLKEHFSNHR
jgi:hypothetical protein